jgi:hypothetical protein
MQKTIKMYINNLGNRSLNFKMLREFKWPKVSLESVRGTTRSLNLKSQKVLTKSIILMFEIRTNSRSTSIRSSLVTRPYYSNLYSKIEQFVRFLREDNVQAEVSSTIAQLIARNWLRDNCVRKLRLASLGDVRVVLLTLHE